MKKLLICLFILGTVLSCKKNTPVTLTETERKIDSLFSIMTLEEKIGQMTQLCFSTITLDGSKTLDLNVNNFREAILKYHVGSFLSGSDSKDKWVEFITAVQKLAIDSSRLKIPLIIGIDHVHGANYVNEGTILPHNLVLSCSFDPSLAALAAKITAIETAPLGLQWNFAPVLDVGKNQYWPRLYETFGEDPLLCAEMGAAFINAYEHCEEIKPYKLAACAKHFIGYSDPKFGWDRSPAEIPDQVLWEFFVPSFKKAFQSGVKTLMVNSGELNGEPVHASHKLLTGLLRERLGFEGVIVTDIKDISKLVLMHHTAVDEKEATLMSVNAGIDMYMACNAYDFCENMKQLVEEGKIPMSRIDQSVRRILKLKVDLGLFENPYPSKDMAAKIGNKEHRKAAKQAALESIVLLKNKGVLPLSSKSKIIVTGLAAHSKNMLNGPWTYEWLGTDDEQRHPAEMKTLLQAIIDNFSEENVKYIKADGIENEEQKNAFIKGLKKDKSDVIIVAVGELPYSEFKGNISDLELDKAQLNLIETAKETGKKVVLMLFVGRPRLITSVIDKVDAIIFAGWPGMMGGEACADILSGKENPSGKLSFSYPIAAGHCINYYYKPSEFNIYWKQYTEPKFLFEFGHGLSYTSYKYDKIEISDTVFTDPMKSIKVSVQVKNTGKREGKETVLWYIQDEVGSLSRPVKMLRHFEKVTIPSGINKRVEYSFIPAEALSFPDENGQMLLEKGTFKVMVGGLSLRFRYQ